MALIVFALHHALVLAVLAATAWSAGYLAMRYVRCREETVPGPMIVAIGLALLTQAALLLGLLEWLRPSIVASLSILLNLAAGREWQRVASVAAREVARMQREVLGRSAMVAAIACPPFLLALYPPLGFDQTVYHLPYARAFAASGAVPFLPALRFPVFPQLAEVLNAAVLLFADDVATQVTGWLALTTCAGLAFVWARELSSAAGGWIAAGVLVGSPIAVYLAATGYVEPMLGLFGLAALYAADRARRQKNEVRWIVTAGALAGSAAGIKYMGLFFVPAAAMLLLERSPWSSAMRTLVWYSVAAALALAPTYGRLIVLTGNPLFPFYPAIFGSSPWDAQEYIGRRGSARLLAVSTFLWDVTFRRQTVGGLPFWSPAFSLGAPVALLGAWREPALRPLMVVAVGYLLVAPVNAHYFLGIAPVWCVIVGAAASSLAGPWRWGERLLVAAAVVLALGGDAYTFYRIHRLGLPPATQDGRERLLAAQLPLYPAIAFLNRTAGPVIVYGVYAEQMVDYVEGTLLGDFNGPASYARVATRIRAIGSVAAALHEIGAEYLLVPSRLSVWTQPAAADPWLTRVYSDGGGTLYRVQPAP